MHYSSSSFHTGKEWISQEWKIWIKDTITNIRTSACFSFSIQNGRNRLHKPKLEPLAFKQMRHLLITLPFALKANSEATMLIGINNISRATCDNSLNFKVFAFYHFKASNSIMNSDFCGGNQSALLHKGPRWIGS